jgi:flagellar hook-length control protein FliK
MGYHPMQIHLSAALPNSTAEPVSNSADQAGGGSATSFFAHMDKIWQSNGEPVAEADEKPDEQGSTKAGVDSSATQWKPAASPDPLDSIQKSAAELYSEFQIDVPGCELNPIPIPIGAANGNPQPCTTASYEKESLRSLRNAMEQGKKDTSAAMPAGNLQGLFSGTATAAAPLDFLADTALNPSGEQMGWPDSYPFLTATSIEDELRANSLHQPQIPEGASLPSVNQVDAGPSASPNIGKEIAEDFENNIQSDLGLDGISGQQVLNDLRNVSKEQPFPSNPESITIPIDSEAAAMNAGAGMTPADAGTVLFDSTTAEVRRTADVQSEASNGADSFGKTGNLRVISDTVEHSLAHQAATPANLPQTGSAPPLFSSTLTEVRTRVDPQSEANNGTDNFGRSGNLRVSTNPTEGAVARQAATPANPPQTSPELTLFNSALTEFRRRVDLQSAANNENENSIRIGNVRMSDDSVEWIDTPQTVTPAKLQNVIQAAPENAGATDARAGQENPKNNPLSWTIPQDKIDSSRVDFGKTKAPSTERSQESSPQVVSVSARLSGTGTTNQAPPEIASQPREFIIQLAERIQVQLRDGKGEIRIQLKPDGLGHLEIRAENTVHGVVARIVAESGSVKNYLETNLHSLQQSLQDQGLRVDRIQVTVQEGFVSHSFSGHASESGHSGSGHQGRGTVRLADMSENYPEELTVDPATWIGLNPNGRFHTVA